MSEETKKVVAYTEKEVVDLAKEIFLSKVDGIDPLRVPNQEAKEEAIRAISTMATFALASAATFYDSKKEFSSNREYKKVVTVTKRPTK